MGKLSSSVLPLSQYFAEFLGTFFIVFIADLLLVSEDAFSGNQIWRPSGIAFATIASMSATYFVSGSHLNPAVSLAFGLTRKMPLRKTITYMLVQVVAGIAACILAHEMLRKPIPSLQPKDGYSLIDACLVEGLFSGTYSFVALNCLGSLQNNPKGTRNQFFALAVGMVMISGGHPANEISGGFLNPAISIGLVVGKHSRQTLGRSMLLVAAQVIGSFGAAVLFFLVRPEELAALGVKVDGHGCSRLCSALHAVNIFKGKSDLPGPEEDSASDEEMDVEASVKLRYRPSLTARIMSEFVGTYFVVLTFGLCAVATDRAAYYRTKENQRLAFLTVWSEVQSSSFNSTAMTSAHGGAETDAVSTPYSTGAAVLSMTYSLATVSGAHFNPAITLAVMCSSRDPYVWAEAPIQILAQASAALLAALTYLFISKGQAQAVPKYLPHLGPGDGFSWLSLAGGEMFFTMAVAYVVLCLATVHSPRYPKATSTRSFDFGLAIGCTYMAGAWVMQRVSGGMLNPAISFSVAASGLIHLGKEALSAELLSTYAKQLFQYVAWQCAGGVLASFLFWLVHPLLYKPDPLLQKREQD